MTMLVHLTGAKAARRIERAGIRGRPLGDVESAVFCMPVLPGQFVVSHQWLRELKRWTRERTLVGVYFRVPAEEPAWVGHYEGRHRQLTVGEAAGLILHAPDPRGYEMVLARDVAAGEIHRVRRLPQVIGWRYTPDAHGKRPCPCPVCVPRGSYKSAKLVARHDDRRPRDKPQLLRALREAWDDEAALVDLLWELTWRPRRGGEELNFLAAHPSTYVLETLCEALGRYRGRPARQLLETLAEHPDEDVSAAARRALDGDGRR